MSKNALPDSEASEVVGHIVGIAQTAEGNAVLRSGDVVGRRNMVGKSAVFVKVDDDQSMMYGFSISSIIRAREAIAYVSFQYFDLLTASYRCLMSCSPAAILLVGCIESMVQHSGLI